MADLEAAFSDLVRVEIALWELVDRRLRADHDLTLGRFECLQAIAGHDGARVQDVADALAITVGGASKLVERTVASGLVARTPHPTDRRSSLLEPTPAGREVLAAASASLRDELASRLAGALPPRELDALAHALHALRGALPPTQEPS